MNLDDEIAQLKIRYSQAQLARAKAEALNESAKNSLQEYMSKLQDLYGLDNLEDARAKLAELESDLRTKLADSSASLDSIKL